MPPVKKTCICTILPTRGGEVRTMNIRVRTVLKQENRTVRKGNVMRIWIQLTGMKNRHENDMKILIKNQLWIFGFTMKLPEIIQTSIFIIKKLKTLT